MRIDATDLEAYKRRAKQLQSSAGPLSASSQSSGTAPVVDRADSSKSLAAPVHDYSNAPARPVSEASRIVRGESPIPMQRGMLSLPGRM